MNINTNFSISAQTPIKQANIKKEVSEDSVSIGSRKDIQASYYPQDPYVGKPISTTIQGDDVTAGPDNSRIDTKSDVKPNADGNFIFAAGDPNLISVQTFTAIDKANKLIENSLGRKVKWSFGKEKITVYPDKGEMKNAYYSKSDGSENFFHFKSKKTGEMVYTGNSSEIVYHETGHCNLDGMKPGYLGWNSETMSVHEAFSDIIAMLASMKEPVNAEMFLKQTGGDFRKDNLIANMGEEFGVAVYGRPTLRTAINDFKYVAPETLPQYPPGPGQLGSESHFFSQIFTGTFYDIMEKVFHSYEAEGMSQKEALGKMVDTCSKLMVKGVDNGPPSSAKFKDIALGMLKADELTNNGKNKALLTDIFKNREILAESDVKDTPAIRGNRYINSDNKEGILNFVDANRGHMGLSDNVELNVSRVQRNDDGSEIIDLNNKVEIPLSGSDYGIFNGAVIEVDAGVTLGTRANGEVCTMSSSSISDKDVANIKKDLKEYIKDGRIKFVDPSAKRLKDEDFFDSKGRPYIGYTTYEDGKMKIERSPIIV